MPDIRSLLGLQSPCPTCRDGALKTDADRMQGYCDGCKLTKHGPSGYDYHAAELDDHRPSYPAEAPLFEDVKADHSAGNFEQDIPREWAFPKLEIVPISSIRGLAQVLARRKDDD